MDIANLIESFADFAKQKNIDRPTMIRILEDVFRTMIKKKYEKDDNFDIIINADKGFCLAFLKYSFGKYRILLKIYCLISCKITLFVTVYEYHLSL